MSYADDIVLLTEDEEGIIIRRSIIGRLEKYLERKG